MAHDYLIGKGNSGFETVNALVEHAAVIHVAGPHPVRLPWRTHYVGHLRAVDNTLALFVEECLAAA